METARLFKNRSVPFILQVSYTSRMFAGREQSDMILMRYLNFGQSHSP